VSAPEGLYLSRARLRHDAPEATLHQLLSRGFRVRTAAGHRLIWTLFSDAPERTRDFLWREAEPGVFYLLSPRPPEDRLGLFTLDTPRPFAPVLAVGDRLRFLLRANATVARSSIGKPQPNGRSRGGRCDVVMDALHGVPRGERAAERPRILPLVAREWLSRQGETHGFALAPAESVEMWEAEDDEVGDPALWVKEYRTVRIDRGARTKPMELGLLDLEGTLVVRDPERFVAAVGRGFGRAKAFGCGLMLIRRTA
jgi:CRISPR system Cascade subunit CasE